jgi:Ran GTPase-activating protein 1
MFIGRLINEVPLSLSALTSVLFCKKVKSLDVSDNALGEAGVKGITEFLSNATSLAELRISNCGLGPSGSTLLFQTLKPLNLKLIKVGRNRLENKGAAEAAAYLTGKDCICSLSLKQNGIRQEGMQVVLDALVSHVNLIV